jgi:hypothetical protein
VATQRGPWRRSAGRCNAVERAATLACRPNIIDLIAIIPYYISAYSTRDIGSTNVVRVLRLARTFRVFKLGKHQCVSPNTAAVVLASGAPWRSWD